METNNKGFETKFNESEQMDIYTAYTVIEKECSGEVSQEQLFLAFKIIALHQTDVLRDIDKHIRSTSHAIDFVVEELKNALPEYRTKEMTTMGISFNPSNKELISFSA